MPPQQTALLLLTAVAAYFDIRTRRIPNWLSLTGCLLGFTLNATLAGVSGVRTAALGLGLGLLLYVPLWLLGARGAGDAKLFAAAGSLIGPTGTWTLFILAAIVGGVLAIGLVIRSGAAHQTLSNIGAILNSLAHFERPAQTLKSPDSLRLPHAVVIFLAAVALTILLPRLF